MRKFSIVLGIVTVTVMACGDPASRLPTTPSAPLVTGIELTGPASIAPGQSVQLVLTVRLSDGTTKQPTVGSPIQWSSTNSNVLRVNSTGLATATQVRGEARISVVYGSGQTSRFASREFVVVPDGTYRLTGSVMEADFPTVAIHSALVTASPGSLTAVTDFYGSFRLYGVAPDATVTITKAGYSTVSQNLQLTTHSNRSFLLPIAGPRIVLTGPYTLTIDLTGTCVSNRPLSAGLLRRTYEAQLAQNGSDVKVTLTEPRFRTNSLGLGHWFSGRAGPDGAVFVLNWYDSYYYPYYGPSSYPNIAERLSDSSILISQGTIITTASGGGVTGILQGGMYQWDARFPASNTGILSYCDSSGGTFSLMPR